MGEASFIGTLNSIRAILMKRYLKKKYILSIAFICGILAFSAYNFFAFAQYNSSKLMPPPPVPSQEAKEAANDSSTTRYRIKSTIPGNYNGLEQRETPIDLKSPTNITSQAEYDYETGCYVIRTKIGDKDISTPFMLSPDEYNNLVLRQSMQ